MRRRALPALALALLLAGCGGESGGAPEGKAQAATKLKNKHHEELQALPDNLRRIGLMRAIRDTGNRCPHRVESARYQGDYRDLALWTARCDDNRQWAVFLSASGHVQVRNCAQTEQLGLPRCAELPPAPPQRQRKAARPGAVRER